MDTAVILGAGPEIDFFFSASAASRGKLICFSTNASEGYPTRHHPGIPILNLLEVTESINVLKAQKIERIVTIGSVRIRGAFADARTRTAMAELLSLAPFFLQGSDATRRAYFHKLTSYFEFPLVRDVLPFLFAGSEVAINPDNDALLSTLSQPMPNRTDPDIYGKGYKAKLFRIPPGDLSNIVNRRLYPEKLIRAHREGAVTHFFFDIDRTIVVNVPEMIEYARANRITLQSFREPGQNNGVSVGIPPS